MVERAAVGEGSKREQRREELLDASIDLVRREGPLVSMEQIAAACGVTKPIVYRHFTDRDDLILSMAGRFLDEFIAEVSPALFREDAEPIELLAATTDAYLALIERDTNLYRFISVHAGVDRRDLIVRLVAEQVATVIGRILAERGLDTGRARLWAFGVVGMVQTTGDWWLDEHDLTRAEVVDELTELLWVGLDDLGLGGHSPRSHPKPATTTSPRTRSPRRKP